MGVNRFLCPCSGIKRSSIWQGKSIPQGTFSNAYRAQMSLAKQTCSVPQVPVWFLSQTRCMPISGLGKHKSHKAKIKQHLLTVSLLQLTTSSRRAYDAPSDLQTSLGTFDNFFKNRENNWKPSTESLKQKDEGTQAMQEWVMILPRENRPGSCLYSLYLASNEPVGLHNACFVWRGLRLFNYFQICGLFLRDPLSFWESTSTNCLFTQQRFSTQSQVCSDRTWIGGKTNAKSKKRTI